MPDEPYLREQARAAVQNGKIPARPADRTWGGPAVGAACVICQRPVTQDELEMELEYATPTGGDPELATFHLHSAMFRGVGVRAEEGEQVASKNRRGRSREGDPSPSGEGRASRQPPD
jgi:hypothetical protein